MTSMDTVHQRSLIITVGGVVPGAASHNALNSRTMNNKHTPRHTQTLDQSFESVVVMDYTYCLYQIPDY